MILQSKQNMLQRQQSKCMVSHQFRRESFTAVEEWLKQIGKLAHPNIVTILVGNKCDMKKEQQVETWEGEKFASEHDLLFVEVSALNGDNIEEAFVKCAGCILTKIETEHLDVGQDSMHSVIQLVGPHSTSMQPKTSANNPRSSNSCC
jgi:GTPase SAR1 family protein